MDSNQANTLFPPTKTANARKNSKGKVWRPVVASANFFFAPGETHSSIIQRPDTCIHMAFASSKHYFVICSLQATPTTSSTHQRVRIICKDNFKYEVAPPTSQPQQPNAGQHEMRPLQPLSETVASVTNTGTNHHLLHHRGGGTLAPHHPHHPHHVQVCTRNLYHPKAQSKGRPFYCRRQPWQDWQPTTTMLI